MELVIRDQSSESSNLSKRYEKEREQNDRLQEENEAIKAEKDRKIFEYQTKLERERENFNTRKREVEKRAQDAESKQTSLILQHESEKAQWDQRTTDMKHTIDELK